VDHASPPPASADAETSAIPSDIRALSDSELITATRALNGGASRYLWPIVPLATVATAVLYSWLIAVASCAAAIAACRLAILWHERSSDLRRGQFAKQELCLRYHIGGLARDEAEASAQLAQIAGEGPILLFRAWALPHGGHRFVRIELGSAPRIVICTTPFLADLHRLGAAQARMTQLDLPLPAAHAVRLGALLAQHTAQASEPVEPVVVDGLPCEVVLLRRQLPTLRASLNYSGANAREHSTTSALVAIILEIEADVTGRSEQS
jgi:hypothetical protein